MCNVEVFVCPHKDLNIDNRNSGLAGIYIPANNAEVFEGAFWASWSVDSSGQRSGPCGEVVGQMESKNPAGNVEVLVRAFWARCSPRQDNVEVLRAVFWIRSELKSSGHL